MDTIWRGLSLAFLMLTSVSVSSPGHAQDSAYGASEECSCGPGCVPGDGNRARPPAGSSAEDCSTRVSFVEPNVPTFVPRVRNTTLSEKILQYFQEMLSAEFALTISSPVSPEAGSQ